MYHWDEPVLVYSTAAQNDWRSLLNFGTKEEVGQFRWAYTESRSPK
jgi:hypothetical protein